MALDAVSLLVTGLGVLALAHRRNTDAAVVALDVVDDAEVFGALIAVVAVKAVGAVGRLTFTVVGVDARALLEAAFTSLTGERLTIGLLVIATLVEALVAAYAVVGFGLERACVFAHTLGRAA